MTWSRSRTIFCIAIFCIGLYGTQISAQASADKSILLGNLKADQLMVQAWMFQAGHHMGYLAPDGKPILNDVAHGFELLGQLQRKTAVDTSPTALDADQARFAFLHAAMTSLEGPKIGLAAIANADRADLVSHLAFAHMLDLAGGLDPNSPFHSQTVAFAQALFTGQSALTLGVSRLDQATIATYPQSLSLLIGAKLAIDLGTAKMLIVDQLAIQDQSLLAAIHARAQFREVVRFNRLELIALRGVVSASPYLSTAERANLLGQIDADLAALRNLDMWAVSTKSDSTSAALALLLSQPGVFILIRPKADIILAGAADRSAIQKLMALLPTLEVRIAGAAAKHKNVIALDALLTDMAAQLAAANADIAPLDVEFLPMTAMTSGQIGHDYQVIKVANAALGDANQRLATAKNDAAQIIANT